MLEVSISRAGDAGRIGARVSIAELSVAPAHNGDCGFADGVLLRVLFDFVAGEGGDLAQVEVRQEHRDDDLCGAESAYQTSFRRREVFSSACFDLRVKGLHAVAGVSVELFPLFGAVVESLFLSTVFGRVERGVVRLARISS
ncbi:hypothetical protein [Glaciibacter sp. 2TAF33]|uniref:hypothetical protein n=1 Tax=Glaciibacter sp. 2TAF33 TaxID=3233015 RepID=UPI003F90DB71